MHIVLTGFMATGKTAVGRRLARRLRRLFLDTDELIEKRAGMSVREMFELRGEAAFRRMEHEVVASLAPPRPAVVATGGGTFVDEENRRCLRHLGVVVCLVTSLETVFDRVARGNARPLAVPGAREQLRLLYERRMSAYRKADVLVETDGLSLEQSVRRVLRAIEPRLAAERGRKQERV